jgi:ketosteroid isomerase-like protein
MSADIAAHEAVIERLYRALGAGDGDTMSACYTEDATFEDPAFGRLEDGRGQAMWRMLTSRGGDVQVTLVDRRAGADGTATAHWLADYTFTETGRTVHNDVHASFVFRGGLIAAHRDRFDLRAWGAQALGPVPGLLGYTPLLALMLRRRTSATLAAYIAGEQKR